MKIQNNSQMPFAIFPQMPNQASAPKRDVPKPKREVRNTGAVKSDSTPVQQEVKEEAKPQVKPKVSEKKVRFTSEDVRNGFKMSVILGEPLSRKRFGRR